MSAETNIFVTPNDFSRFQQLQGEVGKVNDPVLWGSDEVGHWFEDFESSEMAVRALVREGTLKRLGFQGETWIADKDDIIHSLESYPRVKSTLGKSDYLRWQHLSVKDVGNFTTLQQSLVNGSIIDVQSGTVLFADEVQQLRKGQKVTTVHISGLGRGYIDETKEVFKVVDGNLRRIRGSLSD